MRVAVIGTSGAGKTTLGRALAAAMGVGFIEIDAINWGAGWRDLNTHDPEAFVQRTAAAVAAEAWVSDGNYGRVRPVVRALGGKELWPGTGNRERFSQWLDKEHPIRWAWDTHARLRARMEAALADPANAHL